MLFLLGVYVVTALLYLLVLTRRNVIEFTDDTPAMKWFAVGMTILAVVLWPITGTVYFVVEELDL